MLIPDYYARLDGPDPLSALELVEPDVRFLIAVPSGEISGGFDELRDYITARPTGIGRVHRSLRCSTDRDIESVYGQVTERGVSIGSFSALGRVSEVGRLSHYQAFFHPEFAMLPAVS